MNRWARDENAQCVCGVGLVCAPGMKVRDRAAAQGRATAMAVRGNEGVVQQDQREGGREACREKGMGEGGRRQAGKTGGEVPSSGTDLHTQEGAWQATVRF
jgi:hypothetical protein